MRRPNLDDAFFFVRTMDSTDGPTFETFASRLVRYTE